MKRKLSIITAASVLALIGAWWLATTPPEYIEIAPPYTQLIPDGPAEVQAATTDSDWIRNSVETLGTDLPGYDEVVLLEEQGRALATAMDGWIWDVNLETGAASRFADPPLSAAGARRDPANPGQVYLCTAKLYGETYGPDEAAGVYRLDLSDAGITSVALRVPMAPARLENGAGQLFAPEQHAVGFDEMRADNSRPIAFCNDLDVSRDGRRIYFSEPYAYEGASMGRGAFREAISLGKNGRLYMIDLDTRRVSLLAQNYTFIDGVLLEYGEGPRETSVLITETVKFSLLRFHLHGSNHPRAGESEELWHSLPGLPDGLDRDAQGRIWIGMVKRRTPIITYAHRNPWIKPLILRLPHALLPVPHETGLMVLSPDAKRVFFNTMHDGSRIQDISVVVPGIAGVYPAAFRKAQRGFHRLPYPEGLSRDRAER